MRIAFWSVIVVALLNACVTKLDTSPLTQYQKDTTDIKTYIQQNGIPAVKLSQGIWFSVDQAGKGIHPNFNDTLTLTYTVKLIPSNTVVEQVITPTKFVLPSLLPGEQVVMPYFQPGSKGKIFIPSFYAYGTNSSSSIPANSNLLYEFSLSAVKDIKLNTDTTTIDSYLASKSINATKHESGLRYTIDSLGTGFTTPWITDSVSVKYTVKNFDGTIIQQQTTPVKFLLSDLILGWRIGLPLVPEGSFTTFYVPSSLAYGPSPPTTSGISPNANLIFGVKLVKVYQH